MTDENVHVIIRQGDGIVARYGAGLLAILPGGSEEVQQQLLDAMRDSCEGKDLPGRTMARRLVGILSQSDPDDVPPFGAAAPNERGWAVILHQGVALDVGQPDGGTRMSGFDASTWVDRIVEGGFERLTLLPDGEEVGSIDTRFRFQGGLVPGSGATLIIDEPASQPAAPAAQGPPTDVYAPADSAQPGPAPAGPPPEEGPAQAPPEAAPQPQDAPSAAQGQSPSPEQAPAPAAVPEAAPHVEQSPPPPQVPGTLGVPPAAPPDQVQAPAPQLAPEPPPQPAAPGEAPAASADEEEPPTLIQAPSRDAEPGMPEPEGQPLPEEDVPFEAISLAGIGAEAKREPLAVLSTDTPKDEVAEDGAPLVYGVLSPTGYFNHPDALYCAVTGVSMLHRTHVLVQRPRPPLGVVVSDDGSTFTLNSNYVVGREPERDPQVEGGDARPLKLSDAERSLSRVHAEIRLVDWDVFIVDRGSANGTYVLPRGAQQWKRLVADTPEKVAPGTRIAFGKRVMTFESHHQINQAAAS